MLRHSGPENVQRDADAVPPWYVVLRGLREAAGVTQAGWAAYLGYGRRTIQRWERGDGPPDAAATEEFVHLCSQRRLLRTYRHGSLAGVTVTAELLRDLISGARLERHASIDASPTPFPDNKLLPLDAVTDLRLLRKTAHNLPFELTCFIGSEQLLREIHEHLIASSLITLTGTGGVGKTRLALHLASTQIDEYADGVWFTALDSVDDPALVAAAVAAAIGVRDQPNHSMTETLAVYLGGRRILLILDNCEHLVESCAELVSHVLRACDGVQVLATSREPLRIAGELILRVPPLTIPETSSGCTGDYPDAPEALKLFLARAETSDPGFALTAQNREAVALICRRLDGIPLAIELAAAWVRVLTPTEIDSRLDDLFHTRSHGLRVTPTRHQTLKSAVAWSYDLLSSEERQLFDRLSVFHGPFSLQAVESVCDRGDVGHILDTVARLVDKSLVVTTAREERDETEYRLLDTLRHYAEQQLRSRDEYQEFRRRHAIWIVETGEQVSTAIHGPEQLRWLQWVARGDANIRAALDWAIDRQDSEVALRLLVALWWPWGGYSVVQKKLCRRYSECCNCRSWGRTRTCDCALARCRSLGQ